MILICGVLLNVIFGLGGKVYATNESALPELFIKAVNPGYTINQLVITFVAQAI